MSKYRSGARPATTGPWVIDTRELGRRPGSSRDYRRTVPAPAGFGLSDVIAVPEGGDVELDVMLESVVEGVLVSGTVTAATSGECSRCLDSIAGEIEVALTELYAYPDSATEATTDEDEISRVVDGYVDLESAARDAVVLALPLVPLCSEDCKGLCPECGGRWADLGSGHAHETIDPRWAALQEKFGEVRDNSEEN